MGTKACARIMYFLLGYPVFQLDGSSYLLLCADAVWTFLFDRRMDRLLLSFLWGYPNGRGLDSMGYCGGICLSPCFFHGVYSAARLCRIPYLLRPTNQAVSKAQERILFWSVNLFAPFAGIYSHPQFLKRAVAAERPGGITTDFSGGLLMNG